MRSRQATGWAGKQLCDSLTRTVTREETNGYERRRAMLEGTHVSHEIVEKTTKQYVRENHTTNNKQSSRGRAGQNRENGRYMTL